MPLPSCRYQPNRSPSPSNSIPDHKSSASNAAPAGHELRPHPQHPDPRRNQNPANTILTQTTKPTPKSEPQRARREAPDDRSRNSGPTQLYPISANSAIPPRGEKRSTTCKTPESKDPGAPQATAAHDRKSRFPSAACNTSTTKPGTRHSQEALHKAPPTEIEPDPGWPTDNEHSSPKGALAAARCIHPKANPHGLHTAEHWNKSPSKTADPPPPQGRQRPRCLTKKVLDNSQSSTKPTESTRPTRKLELSNETS